MYKLKGGAATREVKVTESGTGSPSHRGKYPQVGRCRYPQGWDLAVARPVPHQMHRAGTDDARNQGHGLHGKHAGVPVREERGPELSEHADLGEGEGEGERSRRRTAPLVRAIQGRNVGWTASGRRHVERRPVTVPTSEHLR